MLSQWYRQAVGNLTKDINYLYDRIHRLHNTFCKQKIPIKIFIIINDFIIVHSREPKNVLTKTSHLFLKPAHIKDFSD